MIFRPKRAIAFAARHNVKKADATAVFMPEARAWSKQYGLNARVVHVDNTQPAQRMRDTIIDALLAAEGGEPWDAVAFFCHGWPNGMQLGFDLSTVRELARVIEATSVDHVVVPLYCCSTASATRALLKLGSVGGDGGFADALRDELCRFGATHCRVMGHVTAGHSTKNPHVRFFDGAGSPIGGQGGIEVVRPSSGALWRSWCAELRRDGSPLRYTMPFQSIAEIHAQLAAL